MGRWTKWLGIVMLVGIFGCSNDSPPSTPDGRTAAVATWVGVYLYVRPLGESFAEAFARQPAFLELGDNIEAEAVTLSQMAMRFSGRWKVKAQQYFASIANKTPARVI